MTFGKNEFHYASSLPQNRSEAIFTISTAAPTNITKVHVTDLKASATGSSTIEFGIISTTATSIQNLKFDLGTTDNINFSWELPYPVLIPATTGETRYFAGSASATGVRYVIDGYVETV